jgi:hypothetical protein
MRPIALGLIAVCLAVAWGRPAARHAVVTAAAPPRPVLTFIVRASADADFESRFTIESERLYRELLRGPADEIRELPIFDAYVAVDAESGSVMYRIGADWNLLDEANGRAIRLTPEAKAKLKTIVERLRAGHYGRPVDWREAERILPRLSVFTIVDLETGLRFRVQRRAGSRHADVQPLTKQDTAVMKRIYGGNWSWKRRAILVQAEGGYLAASMHGMPHGGDGIPDNDFRGHFCVHFRGSTTHGSGRSDPGHQLMVHKAAGMLPQYFADAAPTQLVDAYLFAVNQQDPGLTDWMFAADRRRLQESLQRFMRGVRAVRRLSEFEERPWRDALAVDLPVTVAVHRAAGGTERLRITFRLRRTDVGAPWKIDAVEMVQRQGSAP